MALLIHIPHVSIKAITLMDPLVDSTGETNPTTTILHHLARILLSVQSMYMELDRRERKSLKLGIVLCKHFETMFLARPR
eukprot:s2353_g5.t1